MCSAQIGCEVDKHYFSAEFNYKMTKSFQRDFGGDGQDQGRNPLPEEKNGHRADDRGSWGKEETAL